MSISIQKQTLAIAVFSIAAALPLVVSAQIPTVSVPEKPLPSTTSSTSAQSADGTTQILEREAQPMDGEKGNPPVGKQELRDFTNEMKNVQTEAKKILKDLGTISADEWRKTLQDVAASAKDCLQQITNAADEDKRDLMNDCRSMNFFQDVNDVRQQFVPARELKSALNDMKNVERELKRFKSLLKKTPNAIASQTIETLMVRLNEYRQALTTAAMQEQREALEDWYNARFWDEVNPVRAQAELPQQMKSVTKDMQYLLKAAKSASYLKAAQFFKVDQLRLQANVEAKNADLVRIAEYLASGNGEDAISLMEESVYQGWHPGDMRHFLDMIRDSYNRMKGLRDSEIKSQVFEIVDPIIQSFNEGDIREARDGLVLFTQEMQRYERFFKPDQAKRGLDEKTLKALNKLGETIMKKLPGEGMSDEKVEAQVKKQ